MKKKDQKSAQVKEAKARKEKRKKLRLMILLAVFAGLAFQYTQLDESKKRFIVHLAKQVPYLPGRYYA